MDWSEDFEECAFYTEVTAATDLAWVSLVMFR